MLYSNRNHNSTPLIAPVICLKITVTPAIKTKSGQIYHTTDGKQRGGIRKFLFPPSQQLRLNHRKDNTAKDNNIPEQSNLFRILA